MATKNRYWWFIAYPESLFENWIDILEETLLPIYISPLHQYDINPDGSSKKPHYHIIVCFDGPTTYNNVYENICKPIGATIPKQCFTLHGAYDYLTHNNHPDKYQYGKNEIIYLNGATEEEANKDAVTGQYFNHIINRIVTENIRNFRQLVLVIKSENNPSLNEIIKNNVLYWNNFLKKD